MRLLFVLFFVFTSEVKLVEGEPLLVEPKVYSSKPKERHFLYVYNHIRTNIEGNYVWHPRDKGGETYGGIARKIHPKWQGWEYVDAAKPLKRHDRVEAAEFYVMDWYLTLWVREGFEVIEDRTLALNLFDFRIHSSPRTVTKLTSRVLEQMGCEAVVVSENWVDDRFNRVDPVEFALRLKIQRLILFNHIVTNHPSQKVFYGGWCKRLSDI